MFDLPDVRTTDEILDSGFRRAAKSSVGKGRKLSVAKQLSVGRVKILSQYISGELTGYIKGFPSFDRLNPFYMEVLDITVGLDHLKHHLGALDRCRKVVSSIGTESTRKIRGLEVVSEVERARKAAYGRISSALKDASDSLEFLRGSRKDIVSIPSIDPELPTAVIAGYPNVGKSQLVARLSTARPKIASYPFTTKSVSIGIFEVGHHRYQVIDTPGLLDRSYEKRNKIEKQAVSALRYLADAIIFLIDPTETCGYLLGDQMKLSESIGDDFETPVIEVENKSDLKKSASGRLKVSALTGEGIEELRAELINVLAEARRPTEAPASTS